MTLPTRQMIEIQDWLREAKYSTRARKASEIFNFCKRVGKTLLSIFFLYYFLSLFVGSIHKLALTTRVQFAGMEVAV